jgi:hypothetical protein
MTELDPRAPVVYVGPTLSPREVRELLPRASVRPPAARGDLYRDREAGGAIFVLIDGVFTQSLAVSPREVIDLARDEALVIGASSMGALRAAECWPVGVRGVGLVYRLFRSGVITRDDEVGVGTDQDHEYRAISVALVNVRFAAARAVRARLIDRPTARRIVEVAAEIFYPERRWRSILRTAKVADEDGELERFLAARDLKRRDALQALELARAIAADPDRVAKYRRTNDEPFIRRDREHFSRYLGSTPEELRGELAEWLFATGRYHRYLWPLLAGRADFADLEHEGRSERLREILADVLTELLPVDDELALAMWRELEFIGELHAELARMYAAKVLAELAEKESIATDPEVLGRVREEVSIAHDAPSWLAMQASVFEDRLCGAIPFSWIEDCCRTIAAARSVSAKKSRRAR